MKILTYESGKRKIIFEPNGSILPSGFIEAKYKCNQTWLEDKVFARRLFEASLVREATEEEREYYIWLKEGWNFNDEFLN